MGHNQSCAGAPRCKRGCPTITDSNKNTTKRERLGPLNRKRSNSVITSGNCRTACKLAGYSTEIKLYLKVRNQESFQKIQQILQIMK